MSVHRRYSTWPPIPFSETEALLAESGVVAFGLSALMALRAFVSSKRPGRAGASPVVTGMLMRRRLVVGLFLGNATRCVQLILELICKGHGPGKPPNMFSWSTQQRWTFFGLLELVPSFIFLSAFSVVVLFWAQLYYTTVMHIVPLPLLECLVICINIAAYLLLADIAIITLLLKHYSRLRVDGTLLTGFLSIAVGVALFYYGLGIASEISESSKKPSRKRLAQRTAILAIICGGAYLGQGIYYIAWGSYMEHYFRAMDLALYLVTEWFPAAIALALMRPMQRIDYCGDANNQTCILEESTDSEAPLLSPPDLPVQQKRSIDSVGMS